MGPDCTIYVMFTKYAAIMFFILFITQSALLIPLYYTGNGYLTFLPSCETDCATSEQLKMKLTMTDQHYNLLKFTILNLTGDKHSKMVPYAFVFVIFQTCIIYLIAYSFYTQS